MATVTVDKRVGVGNSAVILGRVVYASGENYVSGGISSNLIPLNNISQLIGVMSGSKLCHLYMLPNSPYLRLFRPSTADELASGQAPSTGAEAYFPFIAFGW